MAKNLRTISKALKASKGASPKTKGIVSTSITMPVEMLGEIRRIGLDRKVAKRPGTTASAIVREALTEWLAKQ